MDIREVLNRPEYDFIKTNPHLGGSMILQHLVEVTHTVRTRLILILMFVVVRLIPEPIFLEEPISNR